MNFGVHLSISQGLLSVIDEAKRRNCQTVQIFIQSPRSWTLSTFSSKEVRAFRKRLKKEKISPLIIHTPYLVNLISSNFSLRLKSSLSIVEHLKAGKDLGADYVVTHSGSNPLPSFSVHKKLLIECVEFIFTRYSGKKPLLLLENVAQRDSYFSSIANLAEFIVESGFSTRLGICLDTAHAFAAGYDLSRLAGWKKIIAELEAMGGFAFLKLFHANDSHHPLGSGRDRHANLGEGKIGKRGFYYLVNEPRFSKLPCILETPKMTLEDDLMNLNFIQSLVRV